MPTQFSGIFKFGDKLTGKVTYVQVNDTSGQSAPVILADYVDRIIKPDHEFLPWREDWVP